MQIDELPHDGNGDAIRRAVQSGADLARPMDIDFAVAFSSEEAGAAFQRLVGPEFRTALELDDADDEEQSWTCYCTKSMFLTYESVTKTQESLNAIADIHGGWSDGWGTFGNTQSH